MNWHEIKPPLQSGEIRKFQEEKLRETLHYVQSNSRFYSRLFEQRNVANIFAEHHSPRLEKKIKDIFRAKLRVAPSLKFVTKEEIERVRFSPANRKPVDFVDHRISRQAH